MQFIESALYGWDKAHGAQKIRGHLRPRMFFYAAAQTLLDVKVHVVKHE